MELSILQKLVKKFCYQNNFTFRSILLIPMSQQSYNIVVTLLFF